MLPPPCCTSPDPEPSRIGRCAWAVAHLEGNASCPAHICPVACGICRICRDHPLFKAFATVMWRRAREGLSHAATTEIETGGAIKATALRNSDVHLGQPSMLFDGAVSAVTDGCTAMPSRHCWRVWRPSDPPWPATHPFKETCNTEWRARLRFWDGENSSLASGASSAPAQRSRATRRARGVYVEQPMCLARKDYLSRYIIQQGRWRDCDSYVRMWRDLAGERRDGAKEEPGVILEIGANIGACTVELLLRTDARIIAFEPSAANVYYLTRSLRMLASKRPDITGRVAVFPIGLGDVPMRVPMFAPGDNLGNTRHLSLSSQAQKEGRQHVDHWLPVETTVLPLSWLLPRGLGTVTLWNKMLGRVQGPAQP